MCAALRKGKREAAVGVKRLRHAAGDDDDDDDLTETEAVEKVGAMLSLSCRN